MSVGMWRVPLASVSAGGGGSVIVDGGVLTYANPWVFSEFGPGPRPLAMVGTYGEISDFIDRNATTKVRNQIEELPEIYLSTSYFKPSSTRMRGLFPGLDAVKGVVTGVTDIAGAGIGSSLGASRDAASAAAGVPNRGLSPSEITLSIGGALAGGISIWRMLTKGSTSEGPNPNHGMLIAKLHYLEDEHAARVGSGSMELGDIDLEFDEQFLAL